MEVAEALEIEIASRQDGNLAITSP